MKNRLLIIIVVFISIVLTMPSDAATDIRYARDGNGLIIVVPAKVLVGEWFTIKVDCGSNYLRNVKFLTQSGYWCHYFPSDYIANDIGVAVDGFQIKKDYVGIYDYYRWIIQGLPSIDPVTIDVSLAKEGRILFIVEYQRADGVYGSNIFTIDASCNFGPKNLPVTFSRGTGKPNNETIQWNSCGGTGVISIKGNTIDSSHIYLNGQLILNPSCLNKSPELNSNGIKMVIELIEGLNILDVEIFGKPGSKLQIDFEN